MDILKVNDLIHLMQKIYEEAGDIEVYLMVDGDTCVPVRMVARGATEKGKEFALMSYNIPGSDLLSTAEEVEEFITQNGMYRRNN